MNTELSAASRTKIGAEEGIPPKRRCSPFADAANEARFWAKVDQKNGCWEWTASTQSRGYGCFGINGRIELAHRISYQHFYGSIPDGMQVLHRCDNPPCVNPLHLFLGTFQDNMDDRKVKGHNGLFSGERNGRAKLTTEEALAIRDSVAPATLVAELYG
ncbi:hypothetical protein LCGC14_1898770, partial [marine sediment metagenome]